jgi:ferric-dicitrate binding protein FerR (iron transport regulator)
MPSLTNDKLWDLLSKKICGEATDIELKELEILLNDPDINALAETLTSLWCHRAPSENTRALIALERHIQRMEKKEVVFDQAQQKDQTYTKDRDLAKKHLITKRVIFGISVLVAVVLFFIFVPIKNDHAGFSQYTPLTHPVSQVTTRPGSKTQLRLPDGTSVWLNASSNLTYDENFGNNIREVSLSGEAFFDVVKDPSRPFIIHTKAINIKVLGTEFNVKAYPEDPYTETSLIRGSVEVTIKSRPQEKHYLKPNEKMLVVNDEPEKKLMQKHKEIMPLITTEALTYDSTDNTVVETSWVNNHLIFHQNETFAEMAPRLERWYGVHIIFENQKAANDYKPFVSFTNETITQALDDLKLAYKFNYIINGTEITITQ